MIKKLSISFAILSIVANFAFACSTIKIESAWARPSLGEARTSAIYLNIVNAGAQDNLVIAETDVTAHTELHKTIVENGISKMTHIHNLTIPANSNVEMKPGGLHIMLMQLPKLLKHNEQIKLKLKFETCGIIELEVPVKDVNK